MVFDNAIAVVHHCGADLHRSATEQDELRRILPRRNPADAEMGSAASGSLATCWTMFSAIGFTAGPQ